MPKVKVLRGLAKKVESARKKQGLTIQALSKRSGVCAAVISKIEKRQCRPLARTLGKLSNALGIDLIAVCGVPASNALGRKIKALRMEAGLSQREVAELIELSNQGISHIEIGHVRNPQPTTIAKLEELFSVDLSSLIEPPEPVAPVEEETVAPEAKEDCPVVPIESARPAEHVCACKAKKASDKAIVDSVTPLAIQMVKALAGAEVTGADDNVVVRLNGTKVEAMPQEDLNLLSDIDALPDAQKDIVRSLVSQLKAVAA